MCWNAQASFTMAGIGYLAAYYEWQKIKKPPSTYADEKNLIKKHYLVNKFTLRSIAFIYFSSMECLQGMSYLAMHHETYNSVFAFLGYIHIALQPFVISWFMLSFIPIVRRKQWFVKINLLATIASLGMLAHLIKHPVLPGCFGQSCHKLNHMHEFFDFSKLGVSGCAKNQFICYPGQWHMAWKWPLNHCSWLRYGYFIVIFICPLFYGAYRAMTLVTSSAMLAYFLTGNPDEWAAIWCLLSVVCLLAIKIKWLERILTCHQDSPPPTPKKKKVSTT